MKSFKLVMFLVFSFLFGNHFMNAQQSDSDKKGDVVNQSIKSKKKSQAKAKLTGSINTSETVKLQSKSEIEARAKTAQKTKNSGKGNISSEEARKQRDARIEAIKEANKTKKKKPSKGNN